MKVVDICSDVFAVKSNMLVCFRVVVGRSGTVGT